MSRRAKCYRPWFEYAVRSMFLQSILTALTRLYLYRFHSTQSPGTYLVFWSHALLFWTRLVPRNGNTLLE